MSFLDLKKNKRILIRLYKQSNSQNYCQSCSQGIPVVLSRPACTFVFKRHFNLNKKSHINENKDQYSCVYAAFERRASLGKLTVCRLSAGKNMRQLSFGK